MERPAKILVVDDEPDLELLIKQRFRHRIKNNEVTFEFAANGRIALEKLGETGNGFDMILTDINMPEMTGDEVTHALSLDPLTHDIPVIYLTSLLERGDTEVLDGTFGGHYGVSKNASLVELLQVIAKVMQ